MSQTCAESEFSRTRVPAGRKFRITAGVVEVILVESYRHGFRAAGQGIETDTSGDGQISIKQTIGRVAVLSDLKLRDKTGAVRPGLLGVFLQDGVDVRAGGNDVD